MAASQHTTSTSHEVMDMWIAVYSGKKYINLYVLYINYHDHHSVNTTMTKMQTFQYFHPVRCTLWQLSQGTAGSA